MLLLPSCWMLQSFLMDNCRPTSTLGGSPNGRGRPGNAERDRRGLRLPIRAAKTGARTKKPQTCAVLRLLAAFLRTSTSDLTFFVRRRNYNANGAVHQRVHAVAPSRAGRFAYLICNDRMRLRTSLEHGTGTTRSQLTRANSPVISLKIA